MNRRIPSIGAIASMLGKYNSESKALISEEYATASRAYIKYITRKIWFPKVIRINIRPMVTFK